MLWLLVSLFSWVGVVFFRRTFGIPFLIVIAFLSAFRYYVGSDFDNYVGLYNLAADGYIVPVELSFSLVSFFLASYGFNFQAIFALYTLLTYLFIYLGLKEVSLRKEFLGFAIFFVYVIFYHPSLSIVRQCFAASLAFWAVYRYLHRRHYIRFLLVIMVASFFHLSSVIYLFCIPFYILRPKKHLYYLGMAISALFGVTVFGSLLGYVSEIIGFGYKGYAFEATGIPSPIFLLNTLVLGIGFSIVLNSSVKNDYFLLNILYFILVVRLLALDFVAISRIGQLFIIFIPVFLYQQLFLKLKSDSRAIFFIVLIPVIVLKDVVRAAKDYSYYQYSINLCVYEEPCPISIIGDVPLEDLKIPELER